MSAVNGKMNWVTRTYFVVSGFALGLRIAAYRKPYGSSWTSIFGDVSLDSSERFFQSQIVSRCKNQLCDESIAPSTPCKKLTRSPTLIIATCDFGSAVQS